MEELGLMNPRRPRQLICVPDGAAEGPHEALGGLTPLEAAHMPVLARLAARGRSGWARTIPDGMPAGSDVGIMSILGYDPTAYHTGRAPIEAAAGGISLGPDRVVFRANLVTVNDDGLMVDFTGGHPGSAEARRAIAALQDELGGSVEFHTGLGYRNLMTAPLEWARVICAAPHEVVGHAAPLPRGTSAARLIRLMARSRTALAPLGMAANQIWPWGQGTRTRLPRFDRLFGARGAMVAAVHVARGLGALAGFDVPEVPGATGWHDTDYTAKRDATIHAFEAGSDLVVVHIAATDEAGHAGDLAGKIAALEAWDRLILDGLVSYLDASGPWRMLWIPDHETSTSLRSHTGRPVPFLVAGSSRPSGRRPLGSADRPVAAHELVPAVLRV